MTVTDGDTGEPAEIAFEGPVADAARSAFSRAWGRDPVLVGQGGSIPLVAEFADAFPGAAILVTAVGDPDSRPHGIDESLHLGDFAAACVAETLFLQELADGLSYVTAPPFPHLLCREHEYVELPAQKSGSGGRWVAAGASTRPVGLWATLFRGIDHEAPPLNRVRPAQTS